MATCSRGSQGGGPAARLTGPGMRSGPAPEEEVQPRAPLASAAADHGKSGKRFSARVQMTKEEEEEMLTALTIRHREGRRKFFARMEKRDELRKRLDEVLFKRRCWAATLANQVFALRADVAHVRQQLRVGLKDRDPLPEELDDAERRSNCAYIMNQHIDKAMNMGLDAFVDEHFKFHLGPGDALGWRPREPVMIEDGALLGSVAQTS